MKLWLIGIAALAAAGLAVAWHRGQARRREAFVRGYALPRGAYAALHKAYPTLGPKEQELVGRALRQFFLVQLRAGPRYVSMPSTVTATLWQAFAQHARNHEAFCRRAFGRVLEPTPAVVLSHVRLANAGLRRCFWHACREEAIDPRHATRLPLLFAIDARLGIPNAVTYQPAGRRDASRGDEHRVSDFGSSRFDGGTEGFGDGDGGGGDGGDGGGDGGGD